MVGNQSAQHRPSQSCPTQLQQSQPIESHLLQANNDQGNSFHKIAQFQYLKILTCLQDSVKWKNSKGNEYHVFPQAS